MEEQQLIPTDECCMHYNIEISFIQSLQEYGLLQITTIEEKSFIPSGQLSVLEKLMHLHYDLDINLEGIEAITHLLGRVNELQQQIVSLKNKLRIYEPLD